MTQGTRKGEHNDITDVPGIRVGNAEDKAVRTGVTVVLPDAPCVCSGDVRGGGPGTRETDLLDPATLVTRADAVVLAGGSSYGLGAADGVAAWLGARGRGFALVRAEGVPPSPIVPAAILYDLANGGAKGWGEDPPYRRLGVEACARAGAPVAAPVALGRSGAGFGARAGAGPGGLGSASYVTAEGLVVGALVAVNSFGSARMPGSDAFWSWPFELDSEFGGARPMAGLPPAIDLPADTKLAAQPRANTTIAVIATSASMIQADARRIAIMAQDGLARAIRPVHAPTDGDAVFVLATGDEQPSDPLTLTRIGLLAADCLARAVARGIYEVERQG